jgi:hypothetical protein
MSIRRAASEYGSVVGDQELTVAGTAIGCTVPAGAVSARFTNGAEPVRLRWGTPTASVGHYINPYSVIDLYLDDLTDVKFIRVSSTSTAYVTYFG